MACNINVLRKASIIRSL